MNYNAIIVLLSFLKVFKDGIEWNNILKPNV